MKDIIVCFHMLVTSVACVAQCGSFSFTTQAEIDQFGIDHPDCTDIGDLFIEGEDIFDLTPLSNITSGNEMRIRNCPNLVGGIEFNNLDHCGSLTINSNDNVQHISIPELKTANDGLAFHNNIALQSYEAPKLEYTNLLSIINNRTIQSHNIDLKALKAVQSLAVEECENIEDLTFLSGLEEVEFRFELFRNDQLRSLAGLENLNYIYTFDIYENISLESLEALENLTSVELQLTISRCDALTSLRGLDNIEWIGKGEYTGFFLLENNNSLLSLDALESFSEVGDLVIRQNIKLKNLDPLSNLTTVGGILLITSNIELTDLSGLDNVDVNELDKLDIANNWELESCSNQVKKY